MYMFLFWVMLVGVVVATLQDVKRREVDNWLNFLLIVVGLVFFGVVAFVGDGGSLLFVRAIVVLIVGVVLGHVLYFSHVFAGGDAKLLMGICLFFVGSTWLDSFVQLFVFVFVLFVCGGVYGLVYSLVLFVLHGRKCWSVMRREISDVRFVSLGIFGVVLVLVGLWLGSLFVGFGFLCLLFVVLFSFAKAVEEVVMVRGVSGKRLRVGDWLVSDVKVGNRVIEARFDGLSSDEVALLRRKKKVLIRHGIPFVPAFLIAFVVYYFWGELFVGLILMSFF